MMAKVILLKQKQNWQAKVSVSLCESNPTASVGQAEPGVRGRHKE